MKRLGGGFGGKITRNNILASVCGLAAFITNRYKTFDVIVLYVCLKQILKIMKFIKNVTLIQMGLPFTHQIKINHIVNVLSYSM